MDYKKLFFIFIALFLSSTSQSCQAADLEFTATTNSNYLKKIPTVINLDVSGNTYSLEKATIEKWLIGNAKLEFNRQYQSEIENIYTCQLRKSYICNLVYPVKAGYHIRKNTYYTYDKELISAYINDLSRQITKDPVDAKLQMEDGRVTVFSMSSPGLELNKEESVDIITKYFAGSNYANSLTLPVTQIKPEISTDSINNMGITALIGEGRSNFRGSPKNRIFNIKVATNRFHGILIKPGEEFSFTKILGEVDGDHGYLQELVIKKDKTEPEFGGGICQVSTTTFRAAIYSGLKITARRNHAYPVQYYNPQGIDATVYVPQPDLRFINDTPGYILIQTKIEGTELIFQFYGTDDGRKTEIMGPKITERKPDGSLKATFTQNVYDKNGTLLRADIFNSSYDSPSKYPHPGEETTLSQKPAGWSDNEWKKYKKEHNL
jgi:vancomycin resistance protein YoaR